MQGNHQKKVSDLAMRTIWLLFMLLVILSGCAPKFTSLPEQPESVKQNNQWQPSPTFTAGEVQLHGNPGRFGIQYDTLEAGVGRVYRLYFWGKPEEIGDRYRIVATYKGFDERFGLASSAIEKEANNPANADASSTAKFALDKPGIWRLEVFMDETFFDSIVVEAK